MNKWPREVMASVKRAEDLIRKGNQLDLVYACDALDEALYLLPDDPVLITVRGKILMQLGDVESANSDFKKAMELAPEYAAALLKSLVLGNNFKIVSTPCSMSASATSKFVNNGIVLANNEFLSNELLAHQADRKIVVLTVAFWNNFDNLINNLPIHCLASSVRASGFSGEFVLLINDVDKLPDDYIKLLSTLGIQIVNVGEMLSLIDSICAELNYISFFEKFCFARWLFIKKYLETYNHSGKDILIVDSDILFLINPEQLHEAFSNKTFTTYGCPAFTYLSNPVEWLDQYESGLKKLCKDAIVFSNKLINPLKERRGKAESNGFFKYQIYYDYRIPLASDQDLINALIGNQLLQQDDVVQLCKAYKYDICSNPLFFTYVIKDIGLGFPLKLRVEFNNSKSFLLWANDYRITFLHFQNDFALYCTSILEYLKTTPPGSIKPRSGIFDSALNSFSWELKNPKRVASPLETRSSQENHDDSLKYHYTGRSYSRIALYKKIYEVQSLIYQGFLVSNTPRSLIDKYFQPTPTSFSMKDIFNPETWWSDEHTFLMED